MDPVLGVVAAAFITAGGAIAVAVINARTSAERLGLIEKIRRLTRLVEKLGGDPDDA